MSSRAVKASKPTKAQPKRSKPARGRAANGRPATPAKGAAASAPNVDRLIPGSANMVPPGQARLEAVPGNPAAPADRWSSVAYSGGVFAQWFSDTCIIDLDTIQLPKPGKSLPTRLSHWGSYEVWDPNKSTRIGFVDGAERSEVGLTVRGGFLDNDLANRVRSDAGQGYPWEVSIIADGRWERVPDGDSEVVNGVEMHGGSYILRDATLRAVDFVELGADSKNEIQQLAALAAEHGLIPRPSGARNGAPPMATAKLETVNTDDINMDWLKENKPELVEEMMGEVEDTDETDDTGETDGEGASAEAVGYDEDKKGNAEMSAQPATLAQLRALDGGTPEFVLESLEAKLSLPDAMAKLNKQLVTELAEARKKAELSSEAGGAEAVSRKPAGGAAEPKAALSGTDPFKDWESSAALRAHCSKQCGDNEAAARDWFLATASAQLAAGDSYLVPELVGELAPAQK